MTTLIEEEMNAQHSAWVSLSLEEKKERWLASMDHKIGQKAWFEEDMYISPAFFLSPEERSESLELCNLAVSLEVSTELEKASKKAADDMCSMRDFLYYSVCESLSMYAFTCVLSSGLFSLNADSFSRWWNQDIYGDVFGLTMLDYALEGPITRADLRQIVKDSNWKHGNSCLEAHRAFGVSIVNAILFRLVRKDANMARFDMDGLAKFLSEDVGCDVNALPGKNSIVEYQDGPRVNVMAALYRDKNVNFRKWFYNKLGRDIEADIEFAKSQGWDCDYLYVLKPDNIDVMIDPIENRKKKPRLMRDLNLN